MHNSKIVLFVALVATILVLMAIPSLGEENSVNGVSYINQWYDLPTDFIYQGKSYGDWRGSACGPTSLMMAVSYFRGKKCTPQEVVDAFFNCTIVSGENGEDRLGSAEKISAYAEKFGLQSKYSNVTWETIKQTIDNNGLLVLSTKLTKWGHIVLVTGHKEISGRQYIICNDPAGNELEGYWNKNGSSVMYEFEEQKIGEKWCIEVYSGDIPMLGNLSELRVVSTGPKGTKNDLTTPISITFSQPMSSTSISDFLNHFQIDPTPLVPIKIVKVSDDKKTITILGQLFSVNQKYYVTILPGLTSASGKKLKITIKFNFKTTDQPYSPLPPSKPSKPDNLVSTGPGFVIVKCQISAWVPQKEWKVEEGGTIVSTAKPSVSILFSGYDISREHSYKVQIFYEQNEKFQAYSINDGGYYSGKIQPGEKNKEVRIAMFPWRINKGCQVVWIYFDNQLVYQTYYYYEK